MTEIKNFSPYKIVKKAMVDLKPNEVKVIAGRFGIDEDRKTLSSIGKDLNLSRERIRQIEKEGLRKLASKIVDRKNEYLESIIQSFKKNGGIAKHESIANKFLEDNLKSSKNEFNALHLIFFLMPELKKIDKTRELEASWIIASLSKEDVLDVIDGWIDHLQKVKKPATIDVLVKENPNHSKYEMTFLSELPYISKKLVKAENDFIGLASWPEVNPRNVRDKIYYILKKEGKPLHFELIAKKINEEKFSKKKVVKATVHNELIADNRFVLVGRGIYALGEWGYNPGTVKDIIKNILDIKNSPMKIDEIINEVLKQRTVKKNTILINLQTKPDFKKVGKDSYALAR
ncbi:MAG: hypothetical protein M1324_04670 [Patescibacteria group bacterium]|nr:hypothetical protein [Patescibacteria group bacterium]